MNPNNPVITLIAQGTGSVTQIVRLGGAKGVKVIINITAATGTLPTLLVAIADVIPDGAVTPNVTPAILTGAALAASAGIQTPMVIYPGIAVVANLTASQVTANDIQITATVAGTTPAVTATISVIPLT